MEKFYTDGSKNKDGLGSSFICPSDCTSAMYKTNPDVSIMTMELSAISEALEVALNAGHRFIAIFTDSRNSLQHLARCTSGFRGVSVAYTILNKINYLISHNINLRLQWIPSHIGIAGNEEADRLAKLAVTEGTEFQIKPNYTEILYRCRSKCYNKYKEYFDERSREKGIWYRTIQCEPLRIPWFVKYKLNRQHIIWAHRIRSGHIPSNKFGYLMKKQASPNCTTCEVVEDIHHLLMECSRTKSQRESLMLSLNLNQCDIGMFTKVLSEPASEASVLLVDTIKQLLI